MVLEIVQALENDKYTHHTHQTTITIDKPNVSKGMFRPRRPQDLLCCLCPVAVHLLWLVLLLRQRTKKTRRLNDCASGAKRWKS